MTRVDDLRRAASVGERNSGKDKWSFHRLLDTTGAPWLVHPVIAESYSTALGDAAFGESLDADLPAAALESAELVQCFGAVSDGRSAQGRDYPVAVVLSLCAAAVLAGMRSFTAIAGWVADVPTELLASLYGRPAEFPSKTTLGGVLTGADAAAVGAWLAAQAVVRQTTGAARVADAAGAPEEPGEPALVAFAVDGKSVRSDVDSFGNQGASAGRGNLHRLPVLSQVKVGPKSNEIPLFAPRLDSLAATDVNLPGVVITAPGGPSTATAPAAPAISGGCACTCSPPCTAYRSVSR